MINNALEMQVERYYRNIKTCSQQLGSLQNKSIKSLVTFFPSTFSEIKERGIPINKEKRKFPTISLRFISEEQIPQFQVQSRKQF